MLLLFREEALHLTAPQDAKKEAATKKKGGGVAGRSASIEKESARARRKRKPLSKKYGASDFVPLPSWREDWRAGEECAAAATAAPMAPRILLLVRRSLYYSMKIWSFTAPSWLAFLLESSTRKIGLVCPGKGLRSFSRPDFLLEEVRHVQRRVGIAVQRLAHTCR